MDKHYQDRVFAWLFLAKRENMAGAQLLAIAVQLTSAHRHGIMSESHTRNTVMTTP
jgi:hypothetical protein